ncbi:hypothetical protein ACQJBY_024534 [Aegilops geniculata]
MKTAGTRASSSTFLSLSGLTDELAADVSQSPNEALDLTHIYGGQHVNNNKTPQVLALSRSTSEHMSKGCVLSVSRPSKKVILSDEKREHINAKRRAAYRRKKEEEADYEQHASQPNHSRSDDKKELINARRCATYLKNKENADINIDELKAPVVNGKHDGKHLHRNVPAVDTSGMQDRRRSALGDITNGVQAHSMLILENNSQTKAPGRTTVKPIDDNIPALTISAEPTRSTYTSVSQDEAVLPHTSTISTDSIHDNHSGTQRGTSLTPDQREQSNARRRAKYRKHLEDGTIDLVEKNNTLREWRACSKKKGELSAKRKATYASKKNTPCKESLALPRPDLANLSQTKPLSRGAEDVTSDGEPPMIMPNSIGSSNDDIDGFRDCIMADETTPSDFMDDEYYMFRGEGSDNDALEDDEEANASSAIPSKVDPLDYVYTNIPDTTHILKLDTNCKHCHARKFVSETDGFCCRNGQIELKQPEPIPELMSLWSSMDADSKHFRENIRFFNGHFAFTTLGVSLDENYTNMRSGVYTFRAHGTIYHNVHSFGPSSRPEHLQLYFYDDDPTITHRKATTKLLDQGVVRKLVDILKENPYSQQFRSLSAHKDNLDDYRIDLNTDKRLDQRRYNKPLSSEVAAIWVEGSDIAKRFDRRITLCGNNNERHSIRVTSGAYDPLSYPLFYPRGELGWHPKRPKRDVIWEVVQNPQLVNDDDEDAVMSYASRFTAKNI